MSDYSSTRYMRQWAGTLSNRELEYNIPHCRKLRDCFSISRRYRVYYARLIAVYRAEVLQRMRGSSANAG